MEPIAVSVSGARSALSLGTTKLYELIKNGSLDTLKVGRRTLITGLAERGVDLKAIAEIAGHTSIRTTAMYVEANPRRLARILQDVTW